MSKEEAIKYLKEMKDECNDTIHNVRYVTQEEVLDMAIKALEQEPKIGHWIEKDGFDGDVYYDCSECGESWTTIEGTPWDNEFKYCPNCGAKMVEPQESEDKE